MIELPDMTWQPTGSRSLLGQRLLPTDDPKRPQPDIELAGSALDWELALPLREGLKPTMFFPTVAAAKVVNAAGTDLRDHLTVFYAFMRISRYVPPGPKST